MNILIYVLTMLMLLTLLTYTRIESYRSFAIMDSQFVNYMENDERNFINFKAEQQYKETTVNKNKNKIPTDKSPGSGRLNLYPLLNSDNTSEVFLRTFELTKKLIVSLYHEQTFYKELEKERPQFVDELLQDLVRSSEEQKKALTKPEDLSNFKIENDVKLDGALYDILKGISNIQTDQSSKPFSEDEMTEETSDEATVSLLDYTTINKTGKTRIYLASHLLLQLIYEDELLVEQIIQVRNTIYKTLRSNNSKNDDNNKDVANKAKEKAELSKQFEAQFKRGQAVHYEPILDFTVSGTNPKDYE